MNQRAVLPHLLGRPDQSVGLIARQHQDGRDGSTELMRNARDKLHFLARGQIQPASRENQHGDTRHQHQLHREAGDETALAPAGQR